MESNVGTFDRTARMVLSVALVVAALYTPHSEMSDEILVALAICLFSTGIAEYCPLYHFLGISTNGVRRQAP